jgi:hypothetical protein
LARSAPKHAARLASADANVIRSHRSAADDSPTMDLSGVDPPIRKRLQLGPSREREPLKSMTLKFYLMRAAADRRIFKLYFSCFFHSFFFAVFLIPHCKQPATCRFIHSLLTKLKC